MASSIDPVAPAARSRWLTGLLAAGLIGLLLLPWWHNHFYLRDLYDYGLVMASGGLIGRGQHPYVDFTTPIQAGYLGLNYLIEQAAGGTYLGLTCGAAGLIVVMALGLGMLLRRVWPRWIVVLVVAAVTSASAAQHTILWHNALGVFWLAIVVWAGALAPVLNRRDWTSNGMVALGLVGGGLNKLNFQLVALAMALGWAWRAWLTGRASWHRAGLTTLAWLGCGLGLPIGLELAWTGASWILWRDNVITLAAGSRAEGLWAIFSRQFLVSPLYDCYGPLWLPQAGLFGLVISLLAWLGCRPKTPQPDRWLLPLAVLGVSLSGAALLATNQDIAYLGMAAWLVLVVGIWLGFGGTARQVLFMSGVGLPALVLGVAAWSSAWQGQRSQFGYSAAPRSDYREVETAGPTFHYLRGLLLPPDLAGSFALLPAGLPAPAADGCRPVFYGVGLEWVERCLPAHRQPRQPLWVHWGTTYGQKEITELAQAIGRDDVYSMLLNVTGRDEWPDFLSQTLGRECTKGWLGPAVIRWDRYSRPINPFIDGIAFVNATDSNVDGTVLRVSHRATGLLAASGGRLFVGTQWGQGGFELSTRPYRLSGEALVERIAPGPAVSADFVVKVKGADPEQILWQARLALPADSNSQSLPLVLATDGRELEFVMTTPRAAIGQVLAGYRKLAISHATDDTAPSPPRLRPGAAIDTTASPALIEKLFGGTAWRPALCVIRDGQVTADGVRLAAGGEIWLRTPGMLGEISGRISSGANEGGPVVRTVWYKGGRLQITAQTDVTAARPLDFRSWCAEPGGWFGILIDPGSNDGAVVRITATKIELPSGP